MRSFVVFLLLIVVFLFGILTGIDREKQARGLELQTNVSEQEPDPTPTSSLENSADEQVIYESAPTQIHPEQTTQKMAFFLEAIVKGFYEIVVEILYQVASLFV